MHLQAFKISEDDRVLLPVMVCMDGFILTHTYETVDMPTQEEADAFLPPYNPLYMLDPADPYTPRRLRRPGAVPRSPLPDAAGLPRLQGGGQGSRSRLQDAPSAAGGRCHRHLPMR